VSQRTGALVELIDLFPTLVDVCGLPQPKRLEGTSLMTVLRDPTKAIKPAAFTQHPRPSYYDREPDKVPKAMGCSVRTARVRYTEWRDWKTGELIGRELYANDDEPAETRNRIDDSALASAQREAEQLLRARFPKKARP
jgi:iduronate 2-sulfatase